ELAERRRERFAAELEGLAHRRVRRTEEDERVDLGLLRERALERAISVTVADRSAPRIDVRRDQRGERGAVVSVRRRSRRGADAALVEVTAKIGRIVRIRAARVRRRAHAGRREVALDAS